jgi:hypothetical protein
MRPQFYVRVICRDGTTRYSVLFDTLEEADRWRESVREDPLVLAAVMVQITTDRPTLE